MFMYACVYACMYKICVYTHASACMHVHVFMGSVLWYILEAFCAQILMELSQKDFINLSLNATQLLNTKYKQGYYSCSHHSMPNSELFRFPMDIIHLKLCCLNALDVQFVCFYTSTLKFLDLLNFFAATWNYFINSDRAFRAYLVRE